MSTISAGKNWDIFTNSAGVGEIESTGGMLRVSGLGGYDQRAYKNARVSLSAGQKVKVSVWAKKTIGSGSGGGVFIDYPSNGILVASMTIESAEWELHTIEYCAPVSSPDYSYASISFGNISASSGEYFFFAPSIEIEGGGLGPARTLAAGLILSDPSDPKVNVGYFSTGIESITYNASSKSLVIKMTPHIGGGNFTRPLFFASSTTDSPKYEVRLGRYDVSTYTVDAEFYDHSTGQKVEPTTGSFFFQAIIA